MSSQPNPEILFADFLARLEREDGLNFQHWVAGYPELSRELHELHARWAGQESGRSGADFSFFGSTELDPTPPAPGFAPGKRIGDFGLLRLIGRGGMGQVWEAEQFSLGQRRLAIKFVHPERVSERQLAYFEREARAGGRLTHPGIVAVHGFGEDDGVAWIAMELVEGCWTLRHFLDDVLRADDVPAGYDRKVALFLARLALAMQAAHEAGVIHRDLKPQNVLITADDRPKVTDFGLARIVDETALSQTGDVAGTYYYMSPEQISARGQEVDQRTDIFSLGVVMYEMLTLRRPFQGDTAHQVAQQIRLQDPVDMRALRSRIPEDLALICGKALEKDPQRRYATMGELAEDLERHLTDAPIQARAPSTADRLIKWTRRNPTRSAAAAVALLAFVVISVLALRIAGQNRELSLKTEEALLAANAERQRADEVLRLSLAQDHADLVAEADSLWPADPDQIPALESWILRARTLTGQLPELRARRDELRTLARPRTPEELRADREGHRDFGDWIHVVGQLKSRRRALAQRQKGIEAQLPDVDWTTFPRETAALIALARAHVTLDRSLWGEEDIGYVLAEHALESADEDLQATAIETLALASFALGRDEEALGLASLAAETAGASGAPDNATSLAALESAVEQARSEAGLAAEEALLQRLEARLAEIEASLDERRTWTFEADLERELRARWWHGQLTGLVRDLEALADESDGLLAPDGTHEQHGWSIPRRLAFARSLKEQSGADGEFTRRWKEALPAIRSAYPGLEIGPQDGLVPLGPDPRSGLWEFWHVASGPAPKRGDDGTLAPTPDSGLVLVLLPGGPFWAGAQWTQPGARNYDPLAIGSGNEKPVRLMRVSPFFLSKYEMTQGQWAQLTGSWPSLWNAETELEWIEGPHPVESVDLFTSIRVVTRHGLQIPSATQWEYGCRAGSSAPQPFPVQEFASHANVADAAYARRFTVTIKVAEWDDGIGCHAPVGMLQPNAFGLHDAIGNVSEWALTDAEVRHDRLVASNLGIDPLANAGLRGVRGGSFVDPPIGARATAHQSHPPTYRTFFIGLRPARPIQE